MTDTKTITVTKGRYGTKDESFDEAMVELPPGTYDVTFTRRPSVTDDDIEAIQEMFAGESPVFMNELQAVFASLVDEVRALRKEVDCGE